MVLIGIVVGLLCGLLLGGRLSALVNVRLRYAALLFGALFLRYATQAAIDHGVELADRLRLPLYATAFLLLVVALWVNRSQPGLLAVMVGVAANGLAIVVNGGYMPVYLPALAEAGLTPADLSPLFHTILPRTLDAQFLLMAGPLGDVIPFPVPYLTNVVSLGDVLIAAGLGWFVFATLVHGDADPRPGGIALWSGRAETVTLDRPVLLGGGMGPGLAPPVVVAPTRPAVPWPGWLARVRGHPYVRLARDARFSAFWIAQTVSLFGDRLNQVALGVMVYGATGSALATGLVFLAATLPNLFLGPIAGTFVDRWDTKRVLVASDLLRAALVVLVPLIATANLVLVYPIVFAITTVSLFFRPAKSVAVPMIVREDDLMAANSALWTAETIADIGGYPIAGVMVAALGTELGLAFWMDSVSYLVSGALILALTIPPVARQAVPRVSGAVRAFLQELRDGWGVLRGQPTLFQNTLISTFAQLSVGTTLALTVVYAKQTLDGRFIPFPTNWAAIDAVIGVGNLMGGLAVGAIGSRLRKGRLVVTGFVLMGAATILLGLTTNVLVALAASLVIGIFNLVYIIPTQTLFAQLTPEGFLGRVVAFRSSLVFGAMTLAMAVASGVADVIPVGLVIAASGVITLMAGLVGALLPAVRDV